ncbi:MAG: hypothetical protein HPY30_05465 [Gammaproteobacteria bacterium (ex Lamellibrachia satsuma)]|nr:MAG: hypothetical protein HPY30_05465 [Gammaproteobacteria bacterium (ex Lamellibrachia satsuma)]
MKICVAQFVLIFLSTLTLNQAFAYDRTDDELHEAGVLLAFKLSKSGNPLFFRQSVTINGKKLIFDSYNLAEGRSDWMNRIFRFCGYEGEAIDPKEYFNHGEPNHFQPNVVKGDTLEGEVHFSDYFLSETPVRGPEWDEKNYGGTIGSPTYREEIKWRGCVYGSPEIHAFEIIKKYMKVDDYSVVAEVILARGQMVDQKINGPLLITLEEPGNIHFFEDGSYYVDSETRHALLGRMKDDRKVGKWYLIESKLDITEPEQVWNLSDDDVRVQIYEYLANAQGGLDLIVPHNDVYTPAMLGVALLGAYLATDMISDDMDKGLFKKLLGCGGQFLIGSYIDSPAFSSAAQEAVRAVSSNDKISAEHVAAGYVAEQLKRFLRENGNHDAANAIQVAEVTACLMK